VHFHPWRWFDYFACQEISIIEGTAQRLYRTNSTKVIPLNTFPWSYSTVILQRLFHSLYRERQLFKSICHARNITHIHQQEQDQEQHIPISRISRWERPRRSHRRWHRSRRSRSSPRRWSRRSRPRPHRTRWTWSSSWRRRRWWWSWPGWSCYQDISISLQTREKKRQAYQVSVSDSSSFSFSLSYTSSTLKDKYKMRQRGGKAPLRHR
jgi:hypothetical protein